ncbi:MAG: 6-bladed beta-propeller [Deltaproteobacteria bacterium]|nr:6-bladed beta-propeller [Deltaproteobacteria bacterium]
MICLFRLLGKGRLPLAVGLAALTIPVFAAAPRAACLGGGTSTRPVPTVEFLHSYRAAFGTPTRLAVDSLGNIYVADPALGTVTVRAPDGRFVSRLTGLENPVSIGASHAGTFFVGDGTNGSVAVVTLDGDILGKLGQGDGEFGMPGDIDVDATTGYVYVTDSADDRVNIYAGSGAFLSSFGTSGSGDGEFNFPTGIFVDAGSNELLVVDQLNFRVQSFTLDGSYNFCLGYFRASAFSPRRDFNSPQGIWADDAGRVFVADAVDGTVKVLDRDGPMLLSIGELGARPGQLRIPMDVVIDPFGRLFIASANNSRLEVFGLDAYVDPEAFIPVEVSLEPDPLDRAAIPDEIAAIVEIPGHRLEQVELSSVFANGVAASSVSSVDRDADGVPELRAAFDYSELFATLPLWGTGTVDVIGTLGDFDFAGTGSIEVVATPCANGIDDDDDGLVDLADPGCRDQNPSSLEDPECNDDIDNDGDGRIDTRDANCWGRSWRKSESPPPSYGPFCGLGAELIGVLPPLLWLHGRRRRRRSGRPHARRAAAAVALSCIALGPAASERAFALDPPHDFSNSIDCSNCHLPHGAAGGAITRVAGNPNLCISCHTPGGLAAGRPFNDADQALPGNGGTSHRWDSGPSGHLLVGLSNTSSGALESGGAFTGRIERIYSITISGSGDVGSASFDWVDDAGNAGSSVSGVAVPLNDGLTLSFSDGAGSPSFDLGDVWTLFVRTDLRLPDPDVPFETAMAFRVADGKVVCSVCHDQHSQLRTPFDPSAPAYGGSGTGWGRHFQRKDNDVNQMCKVCHEVRDVQSADLGSHPVGVVIPSGDFQTPVSLPLDAAGEVECTTCHSPHFSDSGGANGGLGDGYILRQPIGNLCSECHTLADRAAGSHFDAGTGALWPGGQYGSSFPAHTGDKRGACVNCHWPHGWPDDADMPVDYPRLWVERYDLADDGSDPDDAEDLCFTCHDGNPAGSDIRGDFAKGTNAAEIFHHPVADSEQSPGRSVECVDCHNPHQASSDDKLAGVTGVDIDGLPVGPGTADDRPIEQHELCFKCHGDAYNTSRPDTTNKRLDFQTDNSAFHPVAGAGQNQSANLADQLLGGLTTSSTITCSDCHNSEATADVSGLAEGSGAATNGPHGSTHAAIRRASYWTALSGPSNWNPDNFELCFLCHDEQKLVEAREWDDGAATNFYDDIEGKDNLHWVHLEDRADKSRATCKNCHFNVHSNAGADNTQYNIDGTVYTSPPTNVKTHLINFSPDIQPIGGRSKPEWRINTGNLRRRCYLSCHGTDMEGERYRPSQGDDTPTIP